MEFSRKAEVISLQDEIKSTLVQMANRMDAFALISTVPHCPFHSMRQLMLEW